MARYLLSLLGLMPVPARRTTALTPYAVMAREYRASRNRYPFH